MISQETFTACLPLVDRINAAGRGVAASDDTITAALIQASMTPVVDNCHDDEIFMDEWVKSLTAAPVYGGNDTVSIDTDADEYVFIPTTLHGQTVNEARGLVAGSVRRAMDHARNVARPSITAVLDSIENNFNESIRTKEPFEIVDVTLNPIWESPITLSALANYTNVSRVPKVERNDIPRIKLTEGALDNIRTGSAQFDEMVNGLLSECGLAWDDLFNEVFNGTGNIGIWPARPFLSRNVTILKFVMCDHLRGNPVQGTGMSSMEWTTLATSLTNSFGTLALQMLNDSKAGIACKQLVLETDAANGKIYIAGGLYDQWLTAGGKPEVIFGAIMRDRSGALATFDGMLSNSAIYLSTWSNWHTASRIADEAKYDSNLRVAMLTAVLSEIEELSEDMYPPSCTKETMVSNAKAMIAKLSYIDTKLMADCVIGIVCDTIYPHTPAKTLIRAMAMYIENGMDPKDAEDRVAIEYISDWVCGGLFINKV